MTIPSPFAKNRLGDRPRERLQYFGSESLSIQELLAIVVGSGTMGANASDMGDILLKEFGGLDGIATATFEELTTVRGIGSAKACQIRAAFELAKRWEKNLEIWPLGLRSKPLKMLTNCLEIPLVVKRRNIFGRYSWIPEIRS